MGGFIITFATMIMQQVMDDVFSKNGLCNTLTAGVFEAREVILNKFLAIFHEGIKQEDELELIQFLIKECHYTEQEIRAARNGNVAFHDYEECIMLFK